MPYVFAEVERIGAGPLCDKTVLRARRTP